MSAALCEVVITTAAAGWLARVASILHARLALVRAIVERVNGAHPYDVPCVIALPIADGNTAYLKWVEDSTRSAWDGQPS